MHTPLTPAICIIVQGAQAPAFANQTLRSFEILRNVSERQALERSRADCFLWMTGGRELRPQAFEECLWGLQAHEWVTWADTGAAPPPSVRQAAGPLGVTRSTLATSEARRTGAVCRLPWKCRLAAARGGGGAGGAADEGLSRKSAAKPADDPPPADSGPRPHLRNAGPLSPGAWLRHPLRYVARLLPLRFKQSVNQWAGRGVFDLSYYLQFRPRSVLIDGGMIEPLEYSVPRADGRCRIALCTPHLGFGGAESALLEIARQFDRSRFELFLAATGSGDRRLLPQWREAVDHIHDLRQLLPEERVAGALYSMAVNWKWDGLVAQNTPLAYSPLPALKEKLPGLRVIDIVHDTDEEGTFFAALDAGDWIDRRVAVSEKGRRRLIDMAVDEDRIRLIRNGVDLEQLKPGPRGHDRGPARIVFAGRLTERKRPLLLLDIDRELQRDPPAEPYEFVVAGDGPLLSTLRSKIQSGRRQRRFRLLGHVEPLSAVLGGAAALIVTSTGAGLPLVILEALAMETPVISSRVGAVEEAVRPECGILVENDGQEAETFAEAIRELLSDSRRRREMGRAGRALVERNHDLRRAQAGYRRLIEEVFVMGKKP